MNQLHQLLIAIVEVVPGNQLVQTGIIAERRSYVRSLASAARRTASIPPGYNSGRVSILPDPHALHFM